MDRTIWWDGVLQDLRHGARRLRNSPGFTTVAVLTLALGIGANTAVFQIIDAVRLRDLPVASPGELAEVRIVGGTGGMGVWNGRYAQLTQPIWEQLRDHQEAFSGVFAWSASQVRIGQGGETRPANALWVTGDFFRTLGVQAARGRLLLPEDEGACPASRAVVSHSYWQGEMAGRSLGEGASLVVDGSRLDVVGVTPPGFFGLAIGERFDVAIPLCRAAALQRNVFDVAVTGRLRPGWSVERASAHVNGLSPAIFAATVLTGYTPATEERYKAFRLAAYPASAGVSSLRTAYSASLWTLLGITGLVLVMACANLANLMMARASTRDREMAVRMALGASRGRLVRQSFLEAGLLGATGAACGVLLAAALSRVLVWSLSTESSSIHLAVGTDWRVLAFAAVVAVATCLAFGAAPAFRGARAQPIAAMNAAGRGLTASRDRHALQRTMVVAQVAVSLVLLVAALLFVRSFRNLMDFDPGMREEGIAVAFIGFGPSPLAPERMLEQQRALLDEVRAMPGVRDAGLTTNVPLLGGSWGHRVTVGAVEGDSRFTWVSPGYFQTMGIPVLAGRNLEEGDVAAAPRVAVVNKQFVRQFLAGGDPIGRTLRTHPEPGYPATVYEIVGVIPDTRYGDLRSGTLPMAFAPSAQSPAPRPWTAVMIRTDVTVSAMAGAVRRRLATAHPEMNTDAAPFQRLIREGLVGERLMAMLSGFFGVLAALLATVGLYGLVSYRVAHRRHEIGIRMALGATRSRVMTMVMGEAARLLGVGVAIGALLALAIGRAAAALLFGLTPHDPATLTAAGLLLTVIAAGASVLPARRAARLEPMVALRQE